MTQTFISTLYTLPGEYKLNISEITERLSEFHKYKNPNIIPQLSKIMKKTGVNYKRSCIDYDNYIKKYGIQNNLNFSYLNKMTIKNASKYSIICSKKCIDLFMNKYKIQENPITHIIVNSSSVFNTPHIDVDIMESLNLINTTNRRVMSSMGCCGGAVAIQTAKEICKDENNVVLVVCAECVSPFLYNSKKELQNNKDIISNITADYLFSDGFSSLIITSNPKYKSNIVLGNTTTYTVPNTKNIMQINIGPKNLIGTFDSRFPQIVSSVMNKMSLNKNNINLVHPGGKFTLDKIKCDHNININQSYKILHNYGNMLSSTIWFLLNEYLNNANCNKKHNVDLWTMGQGIQVTKTTITVDYINNKIISKL